MKLKLSALIMGAIFLSTAHAQSEEVATLKWVGCGITKTAFMQELAEGYFKKSGIRIDIQGGGATKGIRDAAAGKAEFGGSCRYRLEGAAEEVNAIFKPVAWDALVAIVHPSNPVSNINRRQLRQVFDGEITNWRELGGNNAPIKVYIREGKISGVGHTFRRLVFGDIDRDFPNADKVFPSSGPLERALEMEPNAIAVTGISSARRRSLKVLSLEGAEPSYQNVKSGRYMLYRPLYLVVNARGEDHPYVSGLIRYVHTREGRRILRNNGTVPYLEALPLVMKQIQQEVDAVRHSIR